MYVTCGWVGGYFDIFMAACYNYMLYVMCNYYSKRVNENTLRVKKGKFSKGNLFHKTKKVIFFVC